MKGKDLICMLCLLMFFTGCEEVIDVDLNEAAPRLVIEANLSDLEAVHRIRISETVAFDEAVHSVGVPDASFVGVFDDTGRGIEFLHDEDGVYITDKGGNFELIAGRTYSLVVVVGEEGYQSVCYMPEYVEPDSTGIAREHILGDDYYFATFKFNDPADVRNYYRYDMAINGGQSRFANVFNDKFNDGLYVTHQISDLDEDLVPGDYIEITRYCVDENVFRYWNTYQSTNPGSAAPANPTSNISNGALGYFSVASAKTYQMQIVDMEYDQEGLDDRLRP